MEDIIQLSGEQADYILTLINEHLITYCNNKYVSSIYLSAYRDNETNTPTIELTLVADWFKTDDFTKVVMGYFTCPDSIDAQEPITYVLSMADAKKYKRITETSASTQDEVILSDLRRASRILIDRDGICSRLLSFNNDSNYEINNRAKCIPSIQV